jgi:beta-galactosidase/beta-glucuronidase
MNRFTIIFLLTFYIHSSHSQVWKKTEGRISTPWAEKVTSTNPLPEYPRPQMTRENWMNLNGLWSYAIKPASEKEPSNYDGKILVPFAIESSLSGVTKKVEKENKLWYNREVILPPSFKSKNVLLHFGAVDWQCDIYINGKKAGDHQGGYDPFFINITSSIVNSNKFNLTVGVWDPTDDGPQPRGKQVKQPHSIWYTPVTGIWQTVWLEAVPQTYIESLRIIPDMDAHLVSVNAIIKNPMPGDQLRIAAFDGANKVAEETSQSQGIKLKIFNPKLWSPNHPFLYDLKVALLRKGKVVDEVKSYFGMRKISMQPDLRGVQRMALNNEFVFQFGPLDQGWWPDGLYTAPTDEALRFDIEKTKEMGFNMIRKHVKVEPARWYYHCDKLGILVWQDMPSGDLGNNWDPAPGVIGRATDKNRTPESESIFKHEWKAIMQANMNSPCIVTWVPFNEGWGQFKTDEITHWTMESDPSRLVNCASGGNFSSSGHIIDLHNYPIPAMPDPTLYGKNQIIVLGEYGGLGLPIEGHTWQSKDNWGYQSFKNEAELFQKYESFIYSIQSFIDIGLSAAIYTQTTDVEIETNGLLTYDRKVVKMPVETVKQANEKLYLNNSRILLKK